MLLFLLFILFIAAPLYGNAVQDFSFTDLDGNVYTPASLKGTPVVVNIGSHWWKKCKDEAPELQRAYLEYKDKGVLFLGVFTMSKEKQVKKFAEKYQLTFPVGLENGIAESLGAKGMPETIFINRNGLITKRYVRKVKYKNLKTGIEQILK